MIARSLGILVAGIVLVVPRASCQDVGKVREGTVRLSVDAPTKAPLRFVVRRSVERNVTASGMMQHATSDFSWNLEMKGLPPDNFGNPVLELSWLAVRGESTAPMAPKAAFDSTSPPSTPLDDLSRLRLSPITTFLGQTLRVKVLPDARVIGMIGSDALRNSVMPADANAAYAGSYRKIAEEFFSDEGLRLFLQPLFVQLPKKPAKVGETWKPDSVHTQLLGNMEWARYAAENSLVSFDQSDAVVHIGGGYEKSTEIPMPVLERKAEPMDPDRMKEEAMRRKQGLAESRQGSGQFDVETAAADGTAVISRADGLPKTLKLALKYERDTPAVVATQRSFSDHEVETLTMTRVAEFAPASRPAK